MIVCNPTQGLSEGLFVGRHEADNTVLIQVCGCGCQPVGVIDFVGVVYVELVWVRDKVGPGDSGCTTGLGRKRRSLARGGSRLRRDGGMAGWRKVQALGPNKTAVGMQFGRLRTTPNQHSNVGHRRTNR